MDIGFRSSRTHVLHIHRRGNSSDILDPGHLRPLVHETEQMLEREEHVNSSKNIMNFGISSLPNARFRALRLPRFDLGQIQIRLFNVSGVINSFVRKERRSVDQIVPGKVMTTTETVDEVLLVYVFRCIRRLINSRFTPT